jgi:hypothetical protein
VGSTPSGIISFLDGNSTLGTATLNTSAQATFSTSSLALGVHTLTASYAANGTLSAGTASQTVTITGLPDFSLTPSATALTVTAGSSSTSSLLLTPLNNYTGTVTFTCANGLPSGVVCTLSPTALSFAPYAQTPQSAKLTVTVPTNLASVSRNGLVLVLAFSCPLVLFASRRKRAALAALGCIATLIPLSGCGSGAKASTTLHGAYTTVVSATDGTNTHTFTLGVTIP